MPTPSAWLAALQVLIRLLREGLAQLAPVRRTEVAQDDCQIGLA